MTETINPDDHSHADLKAMAQRYGLDFKGNDSKVVIAGKIDDHLAASRAAPAPIAPGPTAHDQGDAIHGDDDDEHVGPPAEHDDEGITANPAIDPHTNAAATPGIGDEWAVGDDLQPRDFSGGMDAPAENMLAADPAAQVDRFGPKGWKIRSNGAHFVVWCGRCDHSHVYGQSEVCPNCKDRVPNMDGATTK